jgi:hypothetical protein
LQAPDVALINAAGAASFGDVAYAESYFKRAITIASDASASLNRAAGTNKSPHEHAPGCGG